MKNISYFIISIVSAICFAGFSVSESVAAVVKVNGTTLPQTGSETNIYEGIVNFQADGNFQIEIDAQNYGFVTYSGNGGVGTIPASSTNSVRNPGAYVDKSIGRLSTTGNQLWIETGNGGNILVRVDLSYIDLIPRYYVALVPASDPNIILKESFDLFSWGSDWAMGNTKQPYRVFNSTPSNVKPVDYDGTESPTTTVVGPTITGTTSFNDSEAPLFIKNRDMEGWSFTKVCEMSGYIRLSSPDKGVLKTPALAKLSATSTITVAFDVCRFSAAGNIDFKIEGPGNITSATYVDVIESGVNYGGSYLRNTTPVAISGLPKTSFQINTDMAPQWANLNNDIKYWTRFAVTVSGATSATKIVWDATVASSVNDGRICINNVLVQRINTSNLDNTKKADLLVYPNPVKAGGQLNIVSDRVENVNVSITDIAGKLIKQQIGIKSTLTAPNQAGIYLLQIQQPDGSVHTQRIVVD